MISITKKSLKLESKESKSNWKSANFFPKVFDSQGQIKLQQKSLILQDPIVPLGSDPSFWIWSFLLDLILSSGSDPSLKIWSFLQNPILSSGSDPYFRIRNWENWLKIAKNSFSLQEKGKFIVAFAFAAPAVADFSDAK